ncbi:peptidase M28-like protein [Pontibacter ummariensis]|uniref:Peptidase family M28 n=1 Tax=Pontibacter ummariensis TaxID=1610492 RepID=A0A239HSA5_9BACT|nr:M28 family peptidase [Pontibacter ummariensis]PRY10408.1 peptidase M28-like protein [Pontibacter ummariensis]SNS84075.1 Peptidase family M28 [Pontibacter ummariensis]
MRNKPGALALLLVALVTCYSCTSLQTREAKQAEEQLSGVAVPAFNADSAYAFVARQVAFGPRVPNTVAHKATGDWIASKLTSYGGKVQEQRFRMAAFDGTELNLRNIIASYNPAATHRVMLAAHWDTRPFADKDEVSPDVPIAGANDGGSGVGVLLEIARVLHEANPKPGIGIDLMFFDGEDYGQPANSELPYKEHTWALGSQHWSKNKHVPDYQAEYGILLDMVGAANARFAREGYSMQYARQVVNKVWKAGKEAGFADYFKRLRAPAITDDHYYVNKWGGIPMIDIVEYNTKARNGDSFGPYHHRHKDNMAIISRNTLKAVGQTVLQVLYHE